MHERNCKPFRHFYLMKYYVLLRRVFEYEKILCRMMKSNNVN